MLEGARVPIGIVTGIQGVRWLEARIEGQAAHAGTTPLAFRRDAMAAAAEVIHRLGEEIMPADPDARATVGRLSVEPGSVNAIAHRVAFSIDLRHPDATVLSELEARVRRSLAGAAARRRCVATIERTLDMTPCSFPERMVAAAQEAARSCGVASRRILSGAYHDAMFLATVAPTAMLFVPSRGGLSHNEAEFTEPGDIAAGLAVLGRLVSSLASAR